MKKWLLGIAMLCALSVGHAREPKVMGGTVASYTYFPAELSSTASSGGGLPTVTAGQACTAGEEGKAGVTSAGVLLTCSAGTYSDPKLPPLVEEGDGCRNSVVNGVVDGVVDASLNGRVGRSTIGLTLSCQSGVWAKIAGSTLLADSIGLSSANIPNYVVCFESGSKLIYTFEGMWVGTSDAARYTSQNGRYLGFYVASGDYYGSNFPGDCNGVSIGWLKANGRAFN